MVLYRRVGCPRCSRTGYKGRIGVFQLLVVNDEIEALAARNAPVRRSSAPLLPAACVRCGTTASRRPLPV